MQMAKDDTAQVFGAAMVAGLAFVAEEMVDERLLQPVYSDMKLLGYAVTRKSPQWWIVALLMHQFNSLLFALVYSRIVGPYLPGTGWRRGLLMAMIEGNGLWPLVYMMKGIHPGIKSGAMPPIGGWRDFVAATLRHVAFGVVLGALCPVRERKK
jgi:hypothetical protein